MPVDWKISIIKEDFNLNFQFKLANDSISEVGSANFDEWDNLKDKGGIAITSEIITTRKAAQIQLTSEEKINTCQ